jgi:hypothetical protein
LKFGLFLFKLPELRSSMRVSRNRNKRNWHEAQGQGVALLLLAVDARAEIDGKEMSTPLPQEF